MEELIKLLKEFNNYWGQDDRDLHGLVEPPICAVVSTTVSVKHLEGKTDVISTVVQRLVDTFLVVERHWHRLVQADHEYAMFDRFQVAPVCGIWKNSAEMHTTNVSYYEQAGQVRTLDVDSW